jgi:hypothetical protein
MIWCDLLDKWQSSGKITPRDILKINIFERLQFANFWGIKTNIFKVTKDLIKSATNRERTSRKYERRLKQLEKEMQKRKDKLK